jgi:hypothetical protein
MSDREISKSHGVQSHSHNITGGNLDFLGTKYKPEKDGIGLLTGFRKIRHFRCQICLADIEDVDPEIFPPGEY